VALLELSNIFKTYKIGSVEVHALQDLNTVIEKNEYVSIMGPSGSGKSTLMNVIGCLDTPTKGNYLLDGLTVHSNDKKNAKLDDNKLAKFVIRKLVLCSRHLIYYREQLLCTM